MPLDWIDVKPLSFNVLLLLERVQLSWFPGWVPESELGLALRANPIVEWYLRHKCPELDSWLDGVIASAGSEPLEPGQIRLAEETILRAINDLVVYALDPQIYDTRPFLEWDSRELTGLVDFTGLTAIDVGSGTGRLAFVAAQKAQAVYAVEPVGNLRHFIRQKADRLGVRNLFPVDGLITQIPFQDSFADVTMCGFVFGDHLQAEHDELVRVTKPGGMVILCPGNVDRDTQAHDFLVAQGYQWSRFEAPGDGIKRKYWKSVG